MNPKIEPELRMSFLKATMRKNYEKLHETIVCDIEVKENYTPLLYANNIVRHSAINITGDVRMDDLDKLAEDKGVLHIHQRKAGKSPSLSLQLN